MDAGLPASGGSQGHVTRTHKGFSLLNSGRRLAHSADAAEHPSPLSSWLVFGGRPSSPREEALSVGRHGTQGSHSLTFFLVMVQGASRVAPADAAGSNRSFSGARAAAAPGP